MLCIDCFWHTYTSVNLLSNAYFTFFIKLKAENRLKFQQYSAPAQRVHTTVKPLHREMTDFIITSNLWLLNISDFSPVDYRILAMLQKWVCHILCEMLTSRGNNWLTDRRSLIKWLIGGNLGWGHELWSEVDTLNIWHHPMFSYYTALLVHTFLACDCEAVTHAIVIDVCPSVRLSVCLSNAWIVTKGKHLAKKVQLWLIGSRPWAFQWA